jgi:hypothetical protein
VGVLRAGVSPVDAFLSSLWGSNVSNAISCKGQGRMRSSSHKLEQKDSETVSLATAHQLLMVILLKVIFKLGASIKTKSYWNRVSAIRPETRSQTICVTFWRMPCVPFKPVRSHTLTFENQERDTLLKTPSELKAKRSASCSLTNVVDSWKMQSITFGSQSESKDGLVPLRN